MHRSSLKAHNRSHSRSRLVRPWRREESTGSQGAPSKFASTQLSHIDFGSKEFPKPHELGETGSRVKRRSDKSDRSVDKELPRIPSRSDSKEFPAFRHFSSPRPAPEPPRNYKRKQAPQPIKIGISPSQRQKEGDGASEGVPEETRAKAKDKVDTTTKNLSNRRPPRRKVDLPVNSKQPVDVIVERTRQQQHIGIKLGLPWQLYGKLTKETWASNEAIVARRNESLFAVVEQKGTRNLKELKRHKCPNLVQIYDVFVSPRNCFFVYEYIDVSLFDITVGPERLCKEEEIGTVCKEVRYALIASCRC